MPIVNEVIDACGQSWDVSTIDNGRWHETVVFANDRQQPNQIELHAESHEAAVAEFSKRAAKIGTCCECGAAYDPAFGGYACAK
jgi:hypothetical protein